MKTKMRFKNLVGKEIEVEVDVPNPQEQLGTKKPHHKTTETRQARFKPELKKETARYKKIQKRKREGDKFTYSFILDWKDSTKPKEGEHDK